MAINAQNYQDILEKSFSRAEAVFIKGESFPIDRNIQQACDTVFESETKAYREVLLGCLLTRSIDRSKDIRLPYVKLGPNAFSGRSLDEKIINPFLREKNIPCTGGAFLSVFRRNVKFDESTRSGLKDQQGFDAFLALIANIEKENEDVALLSLLDYVLYRFVLLREQAKVELLKLERISLNQYKQLIAGLLAKQSGGQFPVILALAMVETIKERFSLGWTVEFHGINVADKASGASGDIAIRENAKNLLTIEVTERPVNAHRVQRTFEEKIAPISLSDYVFLVHLERIEDEAKQQAEKYFTQGYDVNFVDIQGWLIHSLVTVGVIGRKSFQENIRRHLASEQISKAIKVAWNEEIQKLTA